MGKCWEIANLGELQEMLEAAGTKGDPARGTAEGAQRCVTFNIE